MLKVILDTSFFCAALKSNDENSVASKILRIWQHGGFTLVMSPQLMEELVYKLLELGVSEDAIEDLVEAIELLGQHIPGAYEATRLDEVDPDDNMFLAAAYEAGADYIVSRDRHLLNEKHFHRTQIVDPPLFLRVLTQEVKL